MRTISRDIVGGFVFSKDNKVLLGLMDPKVGGVYAGYWTVPGGGIDDGETKEQAMRRELREETGIDVSLRSIKFIDDVDFDERVKVQMHFNNFRIHLNKNAREVKPVPNEEFEQLKWFNVANITKINVGPVTIGCFKRWGYVK